MNDMINKLISEIVKCLKSINKDNEKKYVYAFYL